MIINKPKCALFVLVALVTVVAVQFPSASAQAALASQTPKFAQSQDEDRAALSDNQKVVQQLIECFNRHDPKQMAALMHDECEIHYVGEDGKAQLSANRAQDIEKEMEQYFKSLPTVKSQIRKSMEAGRFVSIEEHVA